jgi:hypothetical protein
MIGFQPSGRSTTRKNGLLPQKRGWTQSLLARTQPSKVQKLRNSMRGTLKVSRLPQWLNATPVSLTSKQNANPNEEVVSERRSQA